MPNFNTIGLNVLNRLGLADPGGSASVSDLAYLQTICNEMLGSWSIDRPMIFATGAATYALSANVASYTLGTGGTWNAAAPNRIDRATFIAAVGATTQRRPLRIVTDDVYFAHADLAAAAVTADEIYPDYNFAAGLMKAYLWPVPSCPTVSQVELITWQPLTQFSDMTTSIPLRDGYQDAIEANLAYKACLTAFGASVAQETAAIIAEQAILSRKRVMDLNRMNGLLAPENPPASGGR